MQRWTKGSRLSAAHLNEPVDVLEKLLAQPGALVGGTGADLRERRFDIVIGKIVATGPAAEPDYTGARYWAKPQYVVATALTVDEIETADELAAPQAGDAIPDTVTVTNLAEWVEDTHTLAVDTLVLMLAVYDRQANPVRHYVMSEGGGSPVRWCKVTSLNACGRSFNANPCAVGGVDVDTGTEIVVYTTSPADGQAPTHLALAVNDVVPYMTAEGGVNYQVNPHQLQSFGYQCNTNRSSVGGTDYLADHFVLSTGNYGTSCAGVDVGQVEWAGMRFSTYGAGSDVKATRMVLGESAPPGDTNRAHFVAFTGATSSPTVTDANCGAVNAPTITLNGLVPATMIEGTDPGCGTNSGKLLTLRFSDKFKVTDSGSGVFEVDLRTTDTAVVTDVVCNGDGTITVTTNTAHLPIGCTS